MKRIWLVAALLVAGCVEPRLLDPGEPGPGSISDVEIFTLGFGESRVLSPGEVELTFLRLRGESRCPSDVVCIWEGRGDIRLSLREPGTDTTFVDLFMPGLVALDDSKVHSSVDALGFRLGLLRLDPYPRTDAPIRESDYRARLRVTRTE